MNRDSLESCQSTLPGPTRSAFLSGFAPSRENQRAAEFSPVHGEGSHEDVKTRSPSVLSLVYATDNDGAF